MSFYSCGAELHDNKAQLLPSTGSPTTVADSSFKPLWPRHRLELILSAIIAVSLYCQMLLLIHDSSPVLRATCAVAGEELRHLSVATRKCNVQGRLARVGSLRPGIHRCTSLCRRDTSKQGIGGEKGARTTSAGQRRAGGVVPGPGELTFSKASAPTLRLLLAMR